MFFTVKTILPIDTLKYRAEKEAETFALLNTDFSTRMQIIVIRFSYNLCATDHANRQTLCDKIHLHKNKDYERLASTANYN